MKLRGFLLIPPHPPLPLICIQFSIVLLLTLLETIDSPPFPWKPCDPPSPLAKDEFPLAPPHIETILLFISLFIQNLKDETTKLP